MPAAGVAGQGFVLRGRLLFRAALVLTFRSVASSVFVFDGLHDGVGEDSAVVLPFNACGLVLIFYLACHRGSDFLIPESYGKVFSVFFSF